MNKLTEHEQKIIQAVSDDDVTKLKSLLPNDLTGVKDLYLVHTAAEHGSDECLRFLINAKFDIHQQLEGLHSFSPLHIAASKGKTTSVRLLLENGANTLQKDTFNKLALNHAISQNHIECAVLIVKNAAIKNSSKGLE